jgi:hypothetical protein
MVRVRRRPKRGLSRFGPLGAALGGGWGPSGGPFRPGSGRFARPGADGSVRGPVSPVANKPQIWNPAT